jgi:hypothetical protein
LVSTPPSGLHAFVQTRGFRTSARAAEQRRPVRASWASGVRCRGPFGAGQVVDAVPKRRPEAVWLTVDASRIVFSKAGDDRVELALQSPAGLIEARRARWSDAGRRRGHNACPPAAVCPPPMHAVRATPETRAAIGRSRKRTRQVYASRDQRTSVSARCVCRRPVRARSKGPLARKEWPLEQRILAGR